MPSANMSVIEIVDLHHTYFRTNNHPVQALKSLNLIVPSGEFLAVLGPSGCGKSTLLKLIAGLLKIQIGKILLDGKLPHEMVRKQLISFVFQDPTLLSWRDTQANIRLPLEIAGTEDLDGQYTQSLIKLVHLEGFEKSYPHELSGGMQSRVALARALATSPSVLLMDEPFGSLDEDTAGKLNIELLNIWHIKKSTIVMVTHNIMHSVFLADRIIILSPRPGTIIDDISIDLPRPRSKEILDSLKFFQLMKRVRSSLKS